MPQIIILVLLCVLLWFLFIRPQRRRVHQYQATIAAVRVGDRIVTSGGIYGDVIAIDGDVMTVQVAPGVELRMSKNAIGRRVDTGADAPGWSDEEPGVQEPGAIDAGPGDPEADDEDGDGAEPPEGDVR